MAESPKRPADASRAVASRDVTPGRPAALTGETARAADSVPQAAGPFATLPMRFGRYRIDKLLGKGSMGAVYLAHDIQLDRAVALKVAQTSTSGSAKLIKRMETEAKAAARIDHPRICPVYDFGEIDGIRFIALQYIEGEDLKTYLKRVGRRREPAEAVCLILQIADALKAAHEMGVIHRDLKPENVMLNLNGEPVIMDFGLARRTVASTDAGLTQGMILGTALYMSPEQAIGRAEGIDHRSDIYALGVMLFEMLTGGCPFTGGAMEVMGKKCVRDAPSPLSVNPGLPPRLAEVCHKMIAQRKADRYAGCAELVAALDGIDVKVRGATDTVIVPEELDATVALQDGPSFEFVEVQPTDLPFSKSGPVGKKSVQRQSILSAGMSLFRGGPTGRQRWIAAGGAASLALLGVIIITIRNRDGTKSQFAVPDTSTVEVTTKSSIVPQPSALTPQPSTSWYGWPTDAPKPAIAPFDAEHAKKHQQEWADYLKLPVEHTNSLGMKFVLIPPGEFIMGSPLADIEEEFKVAPKWWHQNLRYEAPQHKVILTQPIYMGAHEVRQKDYEAVMGSNPSQFSATGQDQAAMAQLEPRNHPVECVSWLDAAEFCAKLSQRESLKPFYSRVRETVTPLMNGTGYRLPTEAEWEFACRSGATTKYWIGDKDDDLIRVGWFGTNSGGRTHAAGELKANPLGLYDIHGNVWEWVEDLWEPYHGQFTDQPAINPRSPFSAGSQRVIRGGNWDDPPSRCRASARGSAGPLARVRHYGFRVSLSVDLLKLALSGRTPATGPQSPPESEPEREIIPAGKSFANGQATWRREGNHLIQNSLNEASFIVFGDYAWKDYDFSFEAKKEGGAGEFGLLFRFTDKGNGEFMIGRYDGTWESACSNAGSQHLRIKERGTAALRSDRWYKMSVSVRGSWYRCFLDDRLVFEYDDPRHPLGAVGLWTWRTAGRFRNLRVTDAFGNTLFEGLPETPTKLEQWPPTQSPMPADNAPNTDPQTDVDEAVRRYFKTNFLAKQNLLEAFDRRIQLLATLPDLSAPEKQTRVENLKTEKTTFRQQDTIPFSPSMRPDVIEYLNAIGNAELPVSKAYDRLIEQVTDANDRVAVAEKVAEKKKVLVPKIVGKWIVGDRSGQGEKFSWTLYSNGVIGNDWATWILDKTGAGMVSRIPASKLGDGAYFDTCSIDENGQRFYSSNQFGDQFIGFRFD